MARAPKTPTWPVQECVLHVKIPLTLSQVAERWSDQGKGPLKKLLVALLTEKLEGMLPEIEEELAEELKERDLREELEGAQALSDEALLAAVKERGLELDEPDSDRVG